MGKYNWSIQTLESRVEIIEELLGTEQTADRIDLLTSDLRLLDDLIDEYYDDTIYDMAPLLDCLQGAKESLGDIEFVWNDIKKFRRITKKSIDYPELKTCDLSKSDILELTHDFYKSLNEFFFHNFMTHFSKRRDHIVFRNNDSSLPFRGHTICLPSLSEAFIEINRDHTIDDVLTTVHEYSHATSSTINPKHMLYPKLMFSEIDTIFMELIAADYLEALFKNGQATLNKASRHDEICYTAENLDLIIKLIELEKRIPNGYTSNKVLKSIAKKRLNINPELVEDLLQDPERNGEVYLTCYMFVVELYNMYKNDREKALYYLKQIIELECSCEEEYYSNIKRFGLVPNLSLNEHHQQIHSDVMRLTRKKKNPKHN